MDIEGPFGVIDGSRVEQFQQRGQCHPTLVVEMSFGKIPTEAVSSLERGLQMELDRQIGVRSVSVMTSAAEDMARVRVQPATRRMTGEMEDRAIETIEEYMISSGGSGVMTDGYYFMCGSA